MPPANSIFACRDIREVPREKAVAYARALQYWAEWNKLPTRGEPLLLARSVLGLREEVRWYLSYTDEEIFKRAPLLKEEESLQTPGPTDLPKAPSMPEPVPERRAPKFVGWENVLHPSWPVVAAGDIPWPTRTPRPKVDSETDPSDDIHEAASLHSKGPYSTWALTTDTCLGTRVTADPTLRLCWSNCLITCSWTGRSWSWTTSGHHAPRTGDSSGHHQHELQLYH